MGRISLPNFKMYYIVSVIKTVWYWRMYEYTEQWNGLENPEIDPNKYTQMNFHKGAKTIMEKV